MTDSVFHSIDKSEYGMKSLARSVILLLNKTACLKQRCQQATFFQPGLAWSSLTQPRGRSVMDCLVS